MIASNGNNGINGPWLVSEIGWDDCVDLIKA